MWKKPASPTLESQRLSSALKVRSALRNTSNNLGARDETLQCRGDTDLKVVYCFRVTVRKDFIKLKTANRKPKTLNSLRLLFFKQAHNLAHFFAEEFKHVINGEHALEIARIIHHWNSSDNLAPHLH